MSFTGRGGGASCWTCRELQLHREHVE
uniref:Uncharacterized protein n=1 Tax=Arundo donax TaxID=35708 RepID=A0A0A9HBI7_ARUDO